MLCCGRAVVKSRQGVERPPRDFLKKTLQPDAFQLLASLRRVSLRRKCGRTYLSAAMLQLNSGKLLKIKNRESTISLPREALIRSEAPDGQER